MMAGKSEFLTMEGCREIRRRVHAGLPLPGDPLDVPGNVEVLKGYLMMMLDYLERLERKEADDAEQ